jgi:hypothetical protein
LCRFRLPGQREQFHYGVRRCRPLMVVSLGNGGNPFHHRNRALPAGDRTRTRALRVGGLQRTLRKTRRSTLTPTLAPKLRRRHRPVFFLQFGGPRHPPPRRQQLDRPVQRGGEGASPITGSSHLKWFFTPAKLPNQAFWPGTSESGECRGRPERCGALRQGPDK